MKIAILALAALLTSVVSAILGMAGGIMLLAVMLSFLSHAEAIPTHAAVQIASNGTRALAFLGHVDGKVFVRFLIGAIPGGAVGAWLLWYTGEMDTSEPYLKTAVGAYIVLATWIPVRRSPVGSTHPGGARMGQVATETATARWGFSIVGLAAGVAALTVGAVGPLIAPAFVRQNFVKERLIATKAVCQLATHAMKIPAFILLRDLSLDRLGTLAAVMILMVIPGTLIGKRLLAGIAEKHFKIAFRVALTAAGLKVLVVDGLLKLA